MLKFYFVGCFKSAYILFYQPIHLKHFKLGTYEDFVNCTSSFQPKHPPLPADIFVFILSSRFR